MIAVRRQTILADARRGRVDAASTAITRTRTRTGFSWPWSSSAAGAAGAAAATAASDLPLSGGGSEPTGEEMLTKLTEAIACLQKDVALDACDEWYGPECEGSDPETDQVAECLKKIELSKAGELTALTWQDALSCAGVETTEENKATFAACVLKREESQRVPRGTLAKCAMEVRRGITSGTASTTHSTKQWRAGFETWARTFDVFRQKWEKGSAGEVGVWAAATGIPMEEVARYAASYKKFREQFVDAGGTTTCEEIKIPGSSSWLWWAAGAAVVGIGLVVLFKLPAFLTAIETTKRSFEASRLTASKVAAARAATKAAGAAAEVAARSGS